jgi:hypothetical protein
MEKHKKSFFGGRLNFASMLSTDFKTWGVGWSGIGLVQLNWDRYYPKLDYLYRADKTITGRKGRTVMLQLGYISLRIVILK